MNPMDTHTLYDPDTHPVAAAYVAASVGVVL